MPLSAHHSAEKRRIGVTDADCFLILLAWCLVFPFLSQVRRPLCVMRVDAALQMPIGGLDVHLRNYLVRL